MRTTLMIDDQLYRRAKAKAAMEGGTVTALIERGLRNVLENPVASEKPAPEKPAWMKIAESIPRGDDWKEERRLIEERIEEAFEQIEPDALLSPEEMRAEWKRLLDEKPAHQKI